MNKLGPVVRQHGGTEQSIRLCIDDDYYKPRGLTGFDSFAVSGHFEPGGFDRSTAFSRSALGHSSTTEFRIGKNGVGYDALGSP